MYSTRRWVEGSVQDEPWSFQAAGNVLQTYELTHDLSSNNEQDLCQQDLRGACHHLSRHLNLLWWLRWTLSPHRPSFTEAMPAQVKAIRNWNAPLKKRDLQQFLSFVNFYRKFVKDFSKIARLLHEVTRHIPWKWLPRHQEAFNTLKDTISNATILHTPQDTGKFRIEANNSDFTIGSTLSQLQGRTWKPIAFLSKSLLPARRNYEIYDKKLLAIMVCLDEWCQYVLGAKEQFEIWSDHKNPEYFRKPQNINQWQARWVSILADYDFSLHHLPGSHNSAADVLSQQPNHDDGSGDNTEVIVLKETYFQV